PCTIKRQSAMFKPNNPVNRFFYTWLIICRIFRYTMPLKTRYMLVEMAGSWVLSLQRWMPGFGCFGIRWKKKGWRKTRYSSLPVIMVLGGSTLVGWQTMA